MMCQPSRSSQKGVDTRQCASNDTDSKGRWIRGQSHIELEEGKSASKDAGPEGGGLPSPNIRKPERESPKRIICGGSGPLQTLSTDSQKGCTRG